MLARCAAAVAALSIASAAAAQWKPGMEIVGQQVQVQTNGILNTITFDAGGTAHISSPSGATVVDATWTANAGKLCLQTASTFDCYPYRAPFTARAPVDLISDCGVRSTWTVMTTAVAPFERG
ncbi:MAG TPA: hypothetical protein VIL42_00630 [Sphingomicrobium sp.]|jgi:hypothetical protein